MSDYNIVIALPLLIGLGCLYWSSILDTEHVILQLILQLIFLPFTLISINLAATYIGIAYANNVDTILTLSRMVLYITWIMFGIGAYLCFTLLGRIYSMVKEWKFNKQREKYD